MKGQKFLKITGILMIIGGIFGAIAGVTAILGVSGLAVMLGSTEGTGMLYAASVLCLVSGIVQILAGLRGVKHCENAQMAQTCMKWGIAVVVLSVLGTVLNVVGGGTLSLSSMAVGLLIPALYVYGAYLNGQQA